MVSNILLVDPVSTYRNALARLLTEQGFTVHEKSTVKEALSALKETTFDATIMDNCLPDGFGVDLYLLVQRNCGPTRTILIADPNSDTSSLDYIEDIKGPLKLVYGPTSPHSLIAKTKSWLSIETEPPTEIEIHPKKTPSDHQTASQNQLADLSDTTDVAQRLSELSSVATNPSHANMVTLRQQYQARLPTELLALERALSKIKKNHGDYHSRAEVKLITHTLNGTAGTLGFTEISDAAYAIGKLTTSLSGDAQRDNSIWSEISVIMERAKSAPEHISLMPETPINAQIATVMVIDQDNNTIAQVIEEAKNHLISVIGANNPEQALSISKRSKLDGVLIDMDAHGNEQAFEIAEELRSHIGNENLFIAFTTHNLGMENHVAAVSAGASRVFEKPLRGEELAEAAREFIAEKNKTAPRILAVDDDPFFRAHLRDLLETNNMEVAELADPTKIIETLDQFIPDLILLDMNMPNVDGIDVCRIVRSIPRWKTIPILFLTAETSKKARLRCFEVGGDDFVSKPIIKEEILARISVRLERQRLYKELANIDSLTGLPNRRAFLDRFRLRLADSTRNERPLSLCILDLDKFKLINDTKGHLTGDKVLAGLGRLLSSRFRTVDVRGRWGGEEFAVAFYGEGAGSAKMIITRILNSFSKMTFEDENKETFTNTFSAGVATFPDDGNDFNALFKKADARLYQAKKSGRNCVIEKDE